MRVHDDTAQNMRKCTCGQVLQKTWFSLRRWVQTLGTAQEQLWTLAEWERDSTIQVVGAKHAEQIRVRRHGSILSEETFFAE